MKFLPILLVLALCSPAMGQVFIKVHRRDSGRLVFVNLQQVQTMEPLTTPDQPGTDIRCVGDWYRDYIEASETMDYLESLLTFARQWPKGKPKSSPLRIDTTPKPRGGK